MDDYDLPDLLIEITCQLADQRRYDRIIELFELIQKTQSQRMLAESYPWFFDALSIYYCYRKEPEELRSLANYPFDFVKDYDLMMRSLKLIIHYDQLDVAIPLLQQHYPAIVASHELMGRAIAEVKRFILDYELDKLNRQFQQSGELDRESLFEVSSKYELGLNIDWWAKVETYMTSDPAQVAELF